MSKTAIHGNTFGQSEPLTVRIQGLIRNYPKGVGIFQEFIQNADDAGASEVKIILDRRTFSGKALPSKKMLKLMGPSLMIFNDQVFSDEDLDSIQKIGIGSKSQSSSKTGRFGLGFNACYNISDYPSFLTREGIYFFDPHCDTVEGATMESPGHSWNLTPDVWKGYPDLFSPFKVLGLLTNQDHFAGTVFRLSLRSSDQASHSEISHEPFLEDDFIQLLEKFIPLGVDMLIFLKHVLKITVYEIPDEGHELIELFNVSTMNENEVIENRNIVNSFVSDHPTKMLDNLRNNSIEPPMVSFIHKFMIKTPEFEEQQTWRVVSGFHIDKDNIIVEYVEKMHQIGEKAIPWVGAAARLQVEREGSEFTTAPKVQGKLFCFLPLHISTGLPVHINGYFDLDSSRQTITTDHETLSGKDAIRAKWNSYLINLCIGRAYALLITYLVDDVGRKNIRAYYKFWPNPSKNLQGALKGLSKAIYENLQDNKIIHSADPSQEWCNIHSLLLIPQKWHDDLHSPLSADEMAISKPELPRHILNGYEEAGVILKNITPKLIRDRLRITNDLDKPLAEVDRPCVQNRKWVINLLRYCLSDEPKGDLAGVPLAILTDGHLHTFGLFNATSVFLATEKERKIFPNFKHWFIDPKFAEECELKPIPEADVLQMDIGAVILNLDKILPDQAGRYSSEWQPTSTQVPNKPWLQGLYEYFISHMEDISEYEDDLKKLHLVPDQFNRLWQFSINETPLIPPEDSFQELKYALNKLEIPIVTGDAKLVSMISEFQNKSDGSYIWEFTGRDVIDTLVAFSNIWQTKYTSHIPEIHDPILNFLSTPATIENLKQNDRCITELSKLRIFPKRDGTLTRADEPELYLPASYDLPAEIDSIHLLNPGRNGFWKSLFSLMKIKELDRSTFIQKILLPNYVSLDHNKQTHILEWIRDNLRLAETEQQQKGIPSTQNITNQIAKAPLIICTDGSLDSCHSIYDPRQAESIKAILGDEAKFPDMNIYQDQDRWLKFFCDDLEINTAPKPSAILKAIDNLISKCDVAGVKAVSKELILIYYFIVSPENWNRLSQEKMSDLNLIYHSKTLIDVLKDKKWLPSQQDHKRLKQYASFKLPEDRLYKPSELFFDGHLVSSQKPLASFSIPEREVFSTLGFPKPNLDTVIDHFDAILGSWEIEEHNGIETETLEHSLNVLYRYFGNLKEEAEHKKVSSHYKEKKCLWDLRKKKFFQPSHVFREPVPYMDPLRTQITITENQQDQGYVYLGRLAEPKTGDFVSFLSDLKGIYREGAVPSEVAKQVIEVLRRIVKDQTDYDTKSLIFPVLTQSQLLIDLSDVYVPDANWLLDKLFPDSMHMLHADAPVELISKTGINLLSRSIVQELSDEPVPSTNQKLIKQCNRLQNTIHSDEFTKGVLRLVQKEFGSHPGGDFTRLKHTSIKAVQSIKVTLKLKNSPERIVGTGSANHFNDPEGLIIYLAHQNPRVIYNILAQALNSKLGETKLKDTGNLISILNCRPDEIDGCLTELHIPKLPESSHSGVVYEDLEDSVESFGFSDESETPENEALDSRESDNDEDELDEDELTVEEILLPLPQSGKDTSQVNDSRNAYPSKANSSGENIPEEDDDEYKDPDGFLEFDNNQPAGVSEMQLPTGSNIHRSLRPRSDNDNYNSRGLSDETNEGKYRNTHDNGRSRNQSRRYTKNNRRFTSGVFPSENLHDEDDTNQSQNFEIGNKAVDRVIDYELNLGNKPKRMPHNHPGYDIEVYSPDGQQLLKYIEVKGVNGPWDIGGVSISSTQYSFAHLNPEKFWLYVVEYVFEDDIYKIFPIQNPTRQITHYRFDHGWKELANIKFNLHAEPIVGFYILNKLDQTSAKIINVSGLGSIKRITIQFPDGRKKKVLFKPNLMEVLENNGE